MNGLYGMADATYGDPLWMANLLADEGVGIIQLRCKGWPASQVAMVAERCLRLGPQLVINDHPDVARALGAWVHLGQDDGPDPVDLVFGRSTHTFEQAEQAGSATYIGFGPIFPTGTKESRWSPRGLERLSTVVARSRVPVVAIGGISLEQLEPLAATGVAAWAVVGAIWTSADPRAMIRRFQRS